jgi:hypothetical protein
VFNPDMELLLSVLQATVAEPAAATAGGPPPPSWADAQAALKACGKVDEDVARAVETADADALRAILAQWLTGKRHLLEHDREVLKRALKAFRKRLKITLLDAETSLSGGPMSSGRHSSIVAITPPERYPRATWDELVRQGRLRDAKRGMYELPPE